MVNVSRTNDTTLYPDDHIYIHVTFNAPMVATCSPVLVMRVGGYQDAILVGGNGTNTFLFRYTVSIGDVSFGLYYRFITNALCVVTGCPTTTNCKILAAATNPILTGQYVCV
jgi:hypothetical protein